MPVTIEELWAAWERVQENAGCAEADGVTVEAFARRAAARIPELRERLTLLRAACEQAARPFEELEKSLEIQVLIAPDRAALRQQLHEILQRAPDSQTPDAELAAFIGGTTDALPRAISETWLAGTPDEVEQRVRAYVAEGISHFMLWFIDAPSQVGLRLFADQVAPRFR